MKKERVSISRREFLINSTTLGTGFSLGLFLPIAGQVATAATGTSD